MRVDELVELRQVEHAHIHVESAKQRQCGGVGAGIGAAVSTQRHGASLSAARGRVRARAVVVVDSRCRLLLDREESLQLSQHFDNRSSVAALETSNTTKK